MPLWKLTSDTAGNSPIFGPSNVHKSPNSANRTALYQNTTANAFMNGVTVGVFGITANETTNDPTATHSGWILRKVGSGGRAGRIQTEVLVAGNFGTDAVSDEVIYITLQPVASQNVANGAPVILSISATAVAPLEAVTYQWQVANSTNSFNNLAANANITGVTTNQLSIANTAAQTVGANNLANFGFTYRCLIQATNAANVFTSNAVITTH